MGFDLGNTKSKWSLDNRRYILYQIDTMCEYFTVHTEHPNWDKLIITEQSQHWSKHNYANFWLHQPNQHPLNTWTPTQKTLTPWKVMKSSWNYDITSNWTLFKLSQGILINFQPSTCMIISRVPAKRMSCALKRWRITRLKRDVTLIVLVHVIQCINLSRCSLIEKVCINSSTSWHCELKMGFQQGQWE